MLKRHYFSVIFWVFSVCYITISAQDTPTAFPALTPNLIRSLEITNRLPTSCFEQMFMDKAGKMWLVPCADPQSIRGLHLIQFDFIKEGDQALSNALQFLGHLPAKSYSDLIHQCMEEVRSS